MLKCHCRLDHVPYDISVMSSKKVGLWTELFYSEPSLSRYGYFELKEPVAARRLAIYSRALQGLLLSTVRLFGARDVWECGRETTTAEYAKLSFSTSALSELPFSTLEDLATSATTGSEDSPTEPEMNYSYAPTTSEELPFYTPDQQPSHLTSDNPLHSSTKKDSELFTTSDTEYSTDNGELTSLVEKLNNAIDSVSSFSNFPTDEDVSISNYDTSEYTFTKSVAPSTDSASDYAHVTVSSSINAENTATTAPSTDGLSEHTYFTMASQATAEDTITKSTASSTDAFSDITYSSHETAKNTVTDSTKWISTLSDELAYTTPAAELSTYSSEAWLTTPSHTSDYAITTTDASYLASSSSPIKSTMNEGFVGSFTASTSDSKLVDTSFSLLEVTEEATGLKSTPSLKPESSEGCNSLFISSDCTLSPSSENYATPSLSTIKLEATMISSTSLDTDSSSESFDSATAFDTSQDIQADLENLTASEQCSTMNAGGTSEFTQNVFSHSQAFNRITDYTEEQTDTSEPSEAFSSPSVDTHPATDAYKELQATSESSSDMLRELETTKLDLHEPGTTSTVAPQTTDREIVSVTNSVEYTTMINTYKSSTLNVTLLESSSTDLQSTTTTSHRPSTNKSTSTTSKPTTARPVVSSASSMVSLSTQPEWPRSTTPQSTTTPNTSMAIKDTSYSDVAEQIAFKEETLDAALDALVNQSRCGLSQIYNSATGSCQCEEGRSGDDCQTLENPCGSVPSCLYGGTCVGETCNCLDRYTGTDCGTFDLCDPNPCSNPSFEACKAFEGLTYQCEERVLMKWQVYTGAECNTDPDCVFTSSRCENGKCICRKGTVIVDRTSKECEPGTPVCQGQADCVSDKTLCRVSDLVPSDRSDYLQCLCPTDSLLNISTGLCNSPKVEAAKQEENLEQEGGWRGELFVRYLPVTICVAVVLLCAALYLIRELRKQSSESSRLLDSLAPVTRRLTEDLNPDILPTKSATSQLAQVPEVNHSIYLDTISEDEEEEDQDYNKLGLEEKKLGVIPPIVVQSKSTSVIFIDEAAKEKKQESMKTPTNLVETNRSLIKTNESSDLAEVSSNEVTQREGNSASEAVNMRNKAAARWLKATKLVVKTQAEKDDQQRSDSIVPENYQAALPDYDFDTVKRWKKATRNVKHISNLIQATKKSY